MKLRSAGLATLSFAVLLGSISMPTLAAQEKAEKGQKANIQGMVQSMSRDTSTITIRVGAGVPRQVMYDEKTKFRYGHSHGNKPGAFSAVKETNFISCVGIFNAKNQLMANECVYREAK